MENGAVGGQRAAESDFAAKHLDEHVALVLQRELFEGQVGHVADGQEKFAIVVVAMVN